MTETEGDAQSQEYSGLDFSGQDLSDRTWVDCSFSSCNFSGADLSRCRFEACTLVDCNLSNTKVVLARFLATTFTGCKFVGIEFNRLNHRFTRIETRNCRFEMCNFSDVELARPVFAGAEMADCDFKATRMAGADFSGVRFTDVLFHNAVLDKANFGAATGYAIDPACNSLKKARFSFPEVLGLLRGLDIVIDTLP